MIPRRRSPLTTALTVVALVFAALGIYLNRSKLGADSASESNSSAGGDEGARRAPRVRVGGEPRRVRQLRVSPEKIDLGTLSQCRPVPPIEIVLTNDGTESVQLVGWIATCSCVVPELEAGTSIPAGGFIKVPVHLHPIGLGGKSQRLDFRLEGNARGGSVRIDYMVDTAILPMPVLVVRPDAVNTKIVDLERLDADGQFVAEKFTIRGIEPPVAKFVESLSDGHAAIEIDFNAIDEVAAAHDHRGTMFQWERQGAKERWKSMELTIETDCPLCERLRITVRNR